MLELAKDKKFWERVRTSDDYKRLRDDLLEEYNKNNTEPPRPRSAKEILNNEDHGTYFRNINQLEYAALMALIYPDEEKYYNHLVDVIWAYCNEYTWAPLGHYNDYYNRTPADYDPGLLDIFACSVGFSMAEIKHIFKDRFPKLLVDRMTAEIRRRTIEPYVNRNFFWEKHDNNWTAVCTGSVGAVLMYEAPDLYYKYQKRLHDSMECYLAPYRDDGMCVEGSAYWGFGFGFFCNYALLEREFTNGEVDWFKRDKVKAIATYIQRMYLQPNVVASYGDCNFKEVYWYGLAHILRKVYPRAVEKLPMLNVNLLSYVHFSFGLRAFLYFDPKNVTEKLENGTYYAKDCSYFTKRTDSYGFTCKGGDNGESHNHNDVGSFIFARNNKQLLCDFGYPGPTAKTPGYHGHRRYEYFNPSSFSHNVPYFDGKGQDGCRRAPVFVKYNKKNDVAYMDFTGGYGVEGLLKAERTFYFGENEITLKDNYKLSKNLKITERFVSTVKPRVKGNTVHIDDVYLIGSDNSTLKIAEVPYSAQFPDEKGSFDQICYCFDYQLNEGETEFTLKIQIGRGEEKKEQDSQLKKIK